MSQLTPGANEIFAFRTKADRDAFIVDLKAHGGTRWAVNIDPDRSQPNRYLVAIPKADLGPAAH